MGEGLERDEQGALVVIGRELGEDREVGGDRRRDRDQAVEDQGRRQRVVGERRAQRRKAGRPGLGRPGGGTLGQGRGTIYRAIGSTTLTAIASAAGTAIR